MSRDNINDRLPIVPHESLGADCCGCLVVRLRGELADILCNECAAVIGTVPSTDVEMVISELARIDTICAARCTHCGAVNIFPGMSTVDAFICVECGEGVTVESRVQ